MSEDTIKVPAFEPLKEVSPKTYTEKPVRVLIGTPAFASSIHTDYLHSVLDIQKNKMIQTTVFTLGQESLIPRARNKILSYYYYNIDEYDYLFWLDGDMRIKPSLLWELISLNVDVVGVPTPLKGEVNGRKLFNFNTLPDVDYNEAKPCYPVKEIGTAVLLMSSKAVKALGEASEKVRYDSPTLGDQINVEALIDAFKVGIYDNEYLSEDYYACMKLRELGFNIYAYSSPVIHNGTYAFTSY